MSSKDDLCAAIKRHAINRHYKLDEDRKLTLEFDSIIPLATAENSKAPSDYLKDLPLHAICKYGFDGYNLLKTLVKLYPEGMTVANRNGELPIHILLKTGCREWTGLLDKFMECLKLCVDTFPDSLQMEKADGNLPLHIACYDNGVGEPFNERINFLIEKYPKALELPNNVGNLPLHIMASDGGGGNSDIFEILFQKYPKAATLSNGHGDLPLNLAVHGGKARLVSLLVEKYPYTAKVTNNKGDSPLHAAALRGNLDIFKFLLEKDPDAVQVRNKFGNFPLHLAAVSGNSDILKVLIEKYPGAVKIPNDEGHLPLHYATHMNHKGSVNILIEKYPEGVKVKNLTGEFPSSRSNSIDILRAFETSCPDGVYQHLLFANALHYLKHGCPNFGKKRLKHIEDIFNCAPIPSSKTEIVQEVGEEKKQVIVLTKRLKDVEADSIAKQREQKESHDKKIGDMRSKEIFDLAKISVLEDSLKKEQSTKTEIIQEVEAEKTKVISLTKRLKAVEAESVAKQREQKETHAKKIGDMKSKEILDLAKISFLDDSLKKEQSKHERKRAQVIELEERLRNTQQSPQTANATLTEGTLKSLLEVRKSELFFLSKIDEIKVGLSVEELKAILSSLCSRLSDLKEKVQPGGKPSKTQKYVKCMFALSESGISEMERDDICEVILDINEELVELENINATSKTSVDFEIDTVAHDIKVEGETMGESPVTTSRKRVRASISPDLANASESSSQRESSCVCI